MRKVISRILIRPSLLASPFIVAWSLIYPATTTGWYSMYCASSNIESPEYGLIAWRVLSSVKIYIVPAGSDTGIPETDPVTANLQLYSCSPVRVKIEIIKIMNLIKVDLILLQPPYGMSGGKNQKD